MREQNIFEAVVSKKSQLFLATQVGQGRAGPFRIGWGLSGKGVAARVMEKRDYKQKTIDNS